MHRLAAAIDAVSCLPSHRRSPPETSLRLVHERRQPVADGQGRNLDHQFAGRCRRRQGQGVDNAPEFDETQFVETNNRSGYGYGCAAWASPSARRTSGSPRSSRARANR